MLPDFVPEALQERARIHRLRKGHRLFRSGEAVESIYFVVSGEAKAVRYLPDGSESVMLRAGAGQFFAETGLAIERYVCDAICCSGTAMLVALPVADVRKRLEQDPAFSMAFLLYLAKAVRKQCSVSERLRLKKARERVLHYLICESGPEQTIELQIPLSDWSHELGLEPETLYRVLRELEQDNIIDRDKRRIRLL